MNRQRPSGFLGFTVIWSGQLLSTLGTRMTNFALSIFIWQQTGEVSDLALMTFCAFLSTVVVSPLAGALIDRWNRRLIIVLSDAGSAVTTVAILVLFATGSVDVWHLYLVNIATGAFLAFQVPAYASTISLMMEKASYPRANAMMSLAQSVPGIFAPSAAVALLAVTDIELILVLDSLTYVVAVATVFLAAIPDNPGSGGEKKQGMWRDALFGFRYVFARPGLVGLQGVTFSIILLGVMGWVLVVPMVMARTGDDETMVGVVQSVGAVGGVLGGVLVSVLRPTTQKMLRLLMAIAAFSVLGRILLGLGDSVVVWSIAWACAWGCIPIVMSYAGAIWQEKVEPAVQGRVFATRNLIETLATPIALGTAGPLADHVFEPAMRPGGVLAGPFGGLVGTEAGSGMALLLVLTGLLGIAVAAAGYLIPLVRHVETLLPDHDAAGVPEGALSEAR